MKCAHCGFTSSAVTGEHVCTLACLDWIRNSQLDPGPLGSVSFLEVSRCYDYALALQVGGSHVPGLRQTNRASFI